MMNALSTPPGWQHVSGVLVPGYQVASGGNGNPRFPGGTLHMQTPHFAALGLDLTAFHRGTLNVQIAPRRYHVVHPRLTFHGLRWHPVEPAEDFSFFDVQLLRDGAEPVSGLIYYPHPETKPEHFQDDGVLELLLPFVPGLCYGDSVTLVVPPAQMLIE